MDAEIARRFESLENELRKAVAAGAHQVQIGSTALVAGLSPLIAARITADSKIFAFKKVQNGDVGTVCYACLDGNRVVGAPGSFRVSALDTLGAQQANDISTLDWLVIN